MASVSPKRTTKKTTREPLPLDLAIVIVSWNVRGYLAECLRTVLADVRNSNINAKIWLIDNASTDGTPEFVEELFSNVNLIVNEHNIGFGAANNQGMEAASAEKPRHYFLLNPDTLVRPGAIAALLNWLDTHPQTGMVGSRLVYGDGRLQHSAFQFPGLRQLMFEFWPLPARLYETRLNGRYPTRWYNGNFKPFQIDHPLGASMMVRSAVYQQTLGFDEAFHMYCEEIDWAWRIHKAGWGVYTVPSAEIVHYGGESSKQVAARSVINLWESRAKLYRKYYSPWRMRIAAGIVRSGLARRAARADSPELQDAYTIAATHWK